MKGVRHLHPVPPAAATGLVAEVYAQAERDFGLLPPIPLHSPIPPLLAGAWCVLRETLLVGRQPRALKEGVAAAISRLNRCPYCIDAHILMLAAAGERTAAGALAAGREAGLKDPALRHAVAWATAHRTPHAPELADPPFPSADTAEMIGTSMAFHYINRMAHVFLPETPYPLAAQWAKGPIRRVAAGGFSRRVHGQRRPGDSLALLPDTEPPADHPWAEASPVVAGAFSRFSAVVKEAGGESLPETVRRRVETRLREWYGADPGLGRAWLEEDLAELPESDRPAGRLALLTVFASYRVSDADIAAYRAHHPEDRYLLGAVSWSSYVAARQVGLWLWEALPESFRAAAG